MIFAPAVQGNQVIKSAGDYWIVCCDKNIRLALTGAEIDDGRTDLNHRNGGLYPSGSWVALSLALRDLVG